MSDFNRTINIYVESGAAQQAYDVLAKRQANLTAETAEYIAKGKDIPEKLTKKLEDVTAALDRQAKKLSGELSPSYKDLTGTVSNLTKEVSRMSAQDAGYAKKVKELTEAKEAANAYRNSVINVGAAMEEGKHHSEGFGGAIKEIFAGMTMEKLLEKGVEKIKEFFTEAIKESQALELGQKQLKNALEGVGRVDALEKLNQQAETYSKKFGYLYVPEITKVQDALVTFGRLSMNQINDVMPVIINFSAKTGQSLEESASTILSAMEGNGRALKKFGIEIVKDGTFAQNYGLVMNQLAKRVDGAAAVFDSSASGALARFGVAMKERQEQLGNELLPILAKTLDGVTSFTEALSKAPKFIKDNWNAIFLLIGAYVAYNAATIASTLITTYKTRATIANSIAEAYNATVKRVSAAATVVQTAATNLAQFATAVYTGQITLATAATQAMGVATAFATGGLTLIIGAVAAGASAWAYYATRTKEVALNLQMMGELQGEANKNTVEEKAKLEDLLSVARDETMTKEKRKEAIDQLNLISPEYLKGITLETINTEAAKKAIDDYIKSLDKKALTEAYAAKNVELQKKLIEEKDKAAKDELEWYEKGAIALGTFIDGSDREAKMTAISTQRKKEKVAATEDEIEVFKKLRDEQLKKGNIDTPEEKKHNDDAALRNDQGDKKRDKELDAFKKFYASLEKMHEESLHANDTAEEKETFAIAEKYKEDILKLNQFYKDKVISRAEFDKTMKLMNDTYVRQVEAIKPKYDYENELKAAEAMNVAMLKLNDQRLLKGEISEIEYNARLKVLEETNLQTKTAIAKKYAPIFDKAKEDEVAFEKAANQKEIADYLAMMAEKRVIEETISKYKQETAKVNAAIAGKGAKDETVEKLKALDEWHNEEIKKAKGNNEVLLALTADFEAKKQQIIEDANQQTLSTVAKDIKEYGGDLIKVLSSISKIMENNENSALKADKKANDTKLLQYKHQLDSKHISQKKYDQLVEAANEEMAKKEDDLKRKQFERNKAIKIAEAVINTAAAVLQALANNPPPLSYALAAVAGVLGGVEIGVIASEQYADGTASYGDTLPGQPHSAGGNPILDSKTGQKIGEVERGEAIIPADAAKNNPDVIRQLLTTGRKKNLINQMHPVRQLDQSRNLDNISAAQNQSAYHRSSAASAGTNGSSDSTSQYLQELIHIGREHITETKKVGEKQPVISLTDFHKKEKDYKFILDKQI